MSKFQTNKLNIINRLRTKEFQKSLTEQKYKTWVENTNIFNFEHNSTKNKLYT